MTKNFVVDLIETLTPEELESLDFFLESRYFNNGYNRAVCIQLFGILKDAVRTSTFESLKRSTVFEALYPGKVVVEGKVDKLFTELKGLIYTFLASQTLFDEEDELSRLLFIAKKIRAKGLESRYQQLMDKIKKQSSEKTWIGTNDLLFMQQFAYEEHDWQSAYNKSKGDLKIPDAIHHLELYYFTQKTELLNRLLLQQRLSVLTPETQLLAETPLEVPEDLLGHVPMLDISVKINTLLNEPQPQSEGFYQLLKTLQEQQDKIEPQTLVVYYAYLRNICTVLINAGHKNFHSVLHEINKDNLQRGYFYQQNKIPPNAYLNITQIALSVNDFDWANDFVEQHKHAVAADSDPLEFYQMNKALCLFAEKKFEAALEIIPFGSSYSFYHLLGRRMELKIYYELDSALLPYKIDAFKMFISRAGNKLLPEDLHELHVNFINFLRQLSHSTEILDKARSGQLVKRITEKSRVAERAWLLEKAQELGSRKKIKN